MKKLTKLLEILHIGSSSAKVVGSWDLVEHGLKINSTTPLASLKSSGSYFLLIQCIPTVTYEGDNTVLSQLIAKTLLSEYKSSMGNKKRDYYIFDFINEEFDEKIEISSVCEQNSLEDLFKIFKNICKNVTMNFSFLLLAGLEEKKNMNVVLNENLQSQFVRLGKLAGQYIILNYALKFHSEANFSSEVKSLFKNLLKVRICRLLLVISHSNLRTKSMKFWPKKFSPEKISNPFPIQQIPSTKSFILPLLISSKIIYSSIDSVRTL